MSKDFLKILAIAAITTTFAVTMQVSTLSLMEVQAQDEGGCSTIVNPQGRNCQNPHDLPGGPPVRSCSSPNALTGEPPVSCRIQ